MSKSYDKKYFLKVPTNTFVQQKSILKPSFLPAHDT